MGRRGLVVAAATLAALVGSALAPAGATSPPVARVAPYEYLGWGDPPAPVGVMAATGVHALTLAFVLSHGRCNPQWDGKRPLLGGTDAAAVDAIRAAGGDVDVSFGGWSGSKLGNSCKNATALAAAYQKVIDAYALKAIDIDIEHTEYTNRKVRAKVMQALAIVQDANPSLEISVTFGTTPSGPDASGRSLINTAAALGFLPAAWTIMPFDFGSPIADMGAASVSAGDGLAQAMAASYGIPIAEAYQHIGISSMNGLTDTKGETVTLADVQTILEFAQSHHIARLTFWSVNRDRACATAATKAADNCSGIAQTPYQFTELVAGYAG